VRRWVWDTDMPGALVADEMGLGKTFTSVAAAMLCKLVTEKVVMGLPLSILWGITLEEWVNLAQNDFPGLSVTNGSGIRCGDRIQRPAVY
jgi:SNF2 family DNA or RNA helicase